MPFRAKTPILLFSSPEKRNLVLCLLILIATLATYNPANQHPFVNYDDDRYVTENPHVRSGLTPATIRWAFTSTEQANWHPLTWLSHALDCELFHLNAAGHHFTSVVIHALNAALLFLLLVYATGRWGPSLFVAALFALHPINVESVAWVAERKNVLTTFFWLAATGAYGWYALKPNWQRYLAVVALFACGLMSKPMVITLPFVLLLLDYWPLGRILGTPPVYLRIPKRTVSELLLEKIPLFLLSAASAVITFWAQRAGGSVRSMQQFSIGVRMANAIVAYAMYLWKAIWPAKLAPLYPHPGNSVAIWPIVIAILVLVMISALVYRFRTESYLAVGWLWFLGTLVPVIGLVQVGDAAMADRYAYIPLIGIFAMVAWGAADLADAFHVTLAARILAATVVLTALSYATGIQLTHWSSSFRLWSHTIQVTGPNFIAQDNLGGALLLMGDPDGALPHFQAAAGINPRDPMSHSNMGAYLQQHGELQSAVEQDQIAISLTSDRGLLASTYANLGTAYRELGNDLQARQSYEQAVHLDPNQFNAYFGLGSLLQKQGKLDEALAAYQQALRIAPDSKEAQDAVAALSAGSLRNSQK